MSAYLGYTFVDINLDEEDIANGGSYFKVESLEYSNAFVVRSSYYFDKRVMMGVVYRIDGEGQKRFTVFVVSMVMLLPNIVLAVLDLMFWENGMTTIILGASIVFWLWFLFPLLWKKPIPVVLLGIDALALIGFLKFCSG